MIVLDTNVLSEPLKTMPAQKVVEWLDDQSAETLYITAVNRAELRFGVLKLPEGKRKNALAAQVERVLDLFKDRTLDFNSAAADKLAQIAAELREKRQASPGSRRLHRRLRRGARFCRGHAQRKAL